MEQERTLYGLVGLAGRRARRSAGLVETNGFHGLYVKRKELRSAESSRDGSARLEDVAYVLYVQELRLYLYNTYGIRTQHNTFLRVWHVVWVSFVSGSVLCFGTFQYDSWKGLHAMCHKPVWRLRLFSSISVCLRITVVVRFPAP